MHLPQVRTTRNVQVGNVGGASVPRPWSPLRQDTHRSPHGGAFHFGRDGHHSTGWGPEASAYPLTEQIRPAT